MTTDVRNGPEGVIAAETRLSMVDGERGELVIGGFRVEELSSWSFEDTVELLWNAAGVAARLKAAALPPHSISLLRDVHAEAMDALRMGVSSLSTDDPAVRALFRAAEGGEDHSAGEHLRGPAAGVMSWRLAVGGWRLAVSQRRADNWQLATGN